MTKRVNGKFLNDRKSEYPAQSVTRIVEAAYMLGLIDDFDEFSCRMMREALKSNGRSRELPDGTYQIVKDS
jgi:hypothetical protein